MFGKTMSLEIQHYEESLAFQDASIGASGAYALLRYAMLEQRGTPDRQVVASKGSWLHSPAPKCLQILHCLHPGLGGSPDVRPKADASLAGRRASG